MASPPESPASLDVARGPGLRLLREQLLAQCAARLREGRVESFLWLVPSTLSVQRVLARLLTLTEVEACPEPPIHTLTHLFRRCVSLPDPTDRALLSQALIEIVEMERDDFDIFLTSEGIARAGAVSLLLANFIDLRESGRPIPHGGDGGSIAAAKAMQSLAKRLEGRGALDEGMHRCQLREGFNVNAVRGCGLNPELVVIDGFANLDRDLLQAIATLRSLASEVILLLDDPVDRPGLRGHLEMKLEDLEGPGTQWTNIAGAEEASPMETLAAAFGHQPARRDGLSPTPDIGLQVCRTPHDEAVHIARQIKTLHLEETLPQLSRVAVVFPSRDPMFPLMREALESLGVPHSLPAPAPNLAATPLGQAVLALWRLAARDFHRQDLARVARHPLLSGWLSLEGKAIEQLSREMRVITGLPSWRDRVEGCLRLESERSLRADESDDEERSPSDARRMAQMKSLLGGLDRLAGDLNPLMSPTTLSEALGLLIDLVSRDEVLAALMVNEAEASLHIHSLAALRGLRGELAEAKWIDDRPLPPARLWERGRALLTETSFHLRPPDIDAVQVLTAEQATGVDWDLLVIGGLVEGAWPEVPAVSAFSRMSAGWPQPPDPAENLHRQRHLFWRLLRTAPRRLLLTHAATEGDAPTNPSPLFEEAAHLLGRNADTAPWKVEDVEEIDASLSARELQIGVGHAFANRLGDLDLVADATERFRDAPPLVPVLRGLPCVVARHGDETQWSPWDGRLRDQSVLDFLGRHFADHIWSATSLEGLSRCAWRASAERLQGLSPDEPDEMRVHPREKGQIIHSILCEFMRAWRRRCGGEIARLDAGDFDEANRLLLEIGVRHLKQTAEGEVLWEVERETILGADERPGILTRFLQREIEEGAGLEPMLFEWSFGFERQDREGDGVPAPLIIEHEGHQFRLRGMIDRIDGIRGEEGLCILDYKNSKQGVNSAKVHRGLHLQLPLYALAAEHHLRKEVVAASLVVMGQPKNARELDALFQRRGLGVFAGKRSKDIEEIQALKAAASGHVAQIARRASTGDLTWTTRPVGEVCDRCAWRRVCRRDGDRAEARRPREEPAP